MIQPGQKETSGIAGDSLPEGICLNLGRSWFSNFMMLWAQNKSIVIKKYLAHMLMYTRLASSGQLVLGNKGS
jgi:hypothetical protein